MLSWDKDRNRMQVPGFKQVLLVTGALCLASFLLAACGFSPMYGQGGMEGDAQHGAVTTGFNQIHIGNIPDREGQYLRNALIDRLYTQGRPQDAVYNLTIQPVSETRTDLDITKSSDATRAQMRLNTHMTLSEQATGREVLKRKLVSITSYNVLQSHFTTSVSEDNARRNALDDLARQIEQQLALYFKRRPSP